MIEARGLARTFRTRGGTVEAVRGVDLDVRAGELVGFLGPNGAGKTTTLRMLTTLLRPTAGSATVAGVDLASDPTGVRRRIGYVAQSGGGMPEARVGEEVELQGRLHGLSRAEARSRGALLAERLDLAGLERRPVKSLSGGQRRRLDIAMGLVHGPELLFLDEPTAALDPQSRANLWEHIRTLHAVHGTTVFLTTHYLDEADSLCDRLLVIDNGAIVAEGNPATLKAEVSGDLVEVGVAADDVATTMAIAARIPAATDVAAPDGPVCFRVPRGDRALPELLRALDAAGIATTSLQVQRPTLDDVFLTLTGRSLRDAEETPVAA
ncbi:ABC-type multidrug transport system, ATPase component [Actinokineospora spheciospongiae]|uniref:ABC-type multidrug transport system, ATPase component n=1 Tax=Actinokineospora spheciospongiae TaxID=909613 RepID=W7IDN2_9PSEU|nr:ATP-binding cassette domain-containing protein [Actinokineospora spheciospongiae]EWC58628.1 ABC-type multidrug transport system, ATPase component [Actinokineospora spheciospongiae]